MALPRCPRCGREARTSSAYCPYCGATLPEAKAVLTGARPPVSRPAALAAAPRRGVPWVWVAAALIVLVGLSLAAIIYRARVGAVTGARATAQAGTAAPQAAAAPSETSVRAPVVQPRPTAPVHSRPAATVTPPASPTPPLPASATPQVQATSTAIALGQTATAIAPSAPAAQSALGTATASYDPNLEALLLKNGYEKNIITRHGLRGLRASQRNYSASVWARDLDYAISGYGYALGDMSLFRDSIELFLKDVTPGGVAPETVHLDRLESENRKSWDSMPNLIHMVYIYVAKTGSRDFYEAHRDELQRVGAWIVGLDSDGDGLPDRDDFPYGYYDSVANGVRHTYALAKFYTAFNELAELERYAGRDGSAWTMRAEQLREGFHRPFDQGGYWRAGQAWPIAWRRPDGGSVDVLETFGVFEALRSGLIAPGDGERYSALVAALHSHLPELMDGPTPLRLALGGYDPELRRADVDPPVPKWMLDASAPWVVGLAAPAYAAAGQPADAEALMRAYAAMARATDPPVLEFAAGPQARYGRGDTGDRGRTWDSAAWFLAVYGGHYGLRYTPAALIVQPRPFVALPGDEVHDLSYQGARIQLTLDAAHQIYRIAADRTIRIILRPLGGATRVRVNGGPPQVEESLLVQPSQEYVVVSLEGA